MVKQRTEPDPAEQQRVPFPCCHPGNKGCCRQDDKQMRGVEFKGALPCARHGSRHALGLGLAPKDKAGSDSGHQDEPFILMCQKRDAQ
jgi:hypothetical protein